MSKVKSNYLNCEFDVETYESDGKMIISHTALENIAYNQIPEKANFKARTELLHITTTHCVAKCTVGDRNGRVVEAIGESSTPTLVTEIARSYPALMAAQRAFDRAFIRYLNLPGKVYSDIEGITNDIQEVFGVSEIKVNEIELPKETGPQSATTKPASTNNTKTPETKPKEQSQNPGDTVLAFGKFSKSNKTIAEIHNSGDNYVTWMAETFKPRDETGKKYKKLCVDYLASLN